MFPILQSQAKGERNIKVAIYCRLSEEDRDKHNKQDDSESIQNQKSLLLKYAVDRDWEVYNIYSDDDFTGADRNRPAFNQLLKDAEAKKFDIILCKTQSRFTRELELVEKYIHTCFPMWGIRFISIVDNADTENKGNKKARQINGLINEWYLEDMSDNIKAVFDDKRANGKHIGAFALYGYKKDPNQKGHLIIDEESAEVVREVFTLFANGCGKTNIARILNERGIPNPTEYKRLKGLRYSPPKSKQATLWKYFAIADMLVNEIYIGNMVQGKYGSVSYKTKQNKPRPKEKWFRVEGTHEPIIEKDLWNRVQELVKIKAKPFITGNIGLFAKKVRCKQCGYIMRSQKNHGDYYLQCQTRFISKGACAGAFISVINLKKAIIEELQKFNSEYIDEDELTRNIVIEDTHEQRYEKMNQDIITYQNRIKELDKGIKDLYFDKVKSIIDEDQFVEYSKEMHTQKNKLLKLINELQNKINEHDNKKEANQCKEEIIKEYLAVEDISREMVDQLIDCIYIGEKIPDTRKRTIEIHWNF